NFKTAGGSAANYIAKWNGSSWSALGSGMDSSVLTLAVSGSDLYAGGWFTAAGGNTVNYVARWNGGSWSALASVMYDMVFAGMDGGVHALAVSGSDLYVGGTFTTAGGNSANSVAKWNGTNWSALGSGVTNVGSGTGFVGALAVSGCDL